MTTLGVDMRGKRLTVIAAGLALGACSLLTKLDAPRDGTPGGEADAGAFDAFMPPLDASEASESDDAGDATADVAVDGPPTYYAAQFVEQSFPLSTVALTMSEGQVIPSYIEMENVGGTACDSTVEIGTSVPLNRVSVFADSTWVSPDRPSRVVGTVPPGGVYKFLFDLKAPHDAGTYFEHFGLVAGSVWFGDPGQGGPANDDLEVQIVVVPDAG